MNTTLKPSFRHLVWNSNSSFNVKVDAKENLRNSYHYHPEIELILLKGSAGIQIIGTTIENFSHNEVLLLGKNLPHAFLHQKDLFNQGAKVIPEAIVIQFDENCMGNQFFDLPELKEFRSFFVLSQQGLRITPYGKKEIIPLMEKILHSSPLDRILLLLRILRIMLDKKSYIPIMNSTNEPSITAANEDKRLEEVLNFTFQNYDQNIRIEDVSEKINMTKESFCRYFKARTNKTYMEFLIEFRILKACRMIMENQLSIKEICYSCGFDSLSNFHYQFKKIIKQSPLEYRMSIQNSLEKHVYDPNL